MYVEYEYRCWAGTASFSCCAVDLARLIAMFIESNGAVAVDFKLIIMRIIASAFCTIFCYDLCEWK